MESSHAKSLLPMWVKMSLKKLESKKKIQRSSSTIKARAVFESTETEKFKNAQDYNPRPPGSWEIAKTKVETVLMDTQYY